MVERQRRGAELRRTDREEGLRLLYGASLDVARQRGLIPEGRSPSFDHSTLDRGRYKLRDQEDRLLATVTLQEGRAMLAFRREIGREVLEKVKVSVNSDNPGSLEKRQIRIQKPEVRAMAWAISTGRRIPMPVRRRLEPLVSLLLLLCGLVPGIIYIWRGLHQRRRYRKNLEELVQRWRMAGKPDPSDSFFSLFHL